MAQVTWVGLDVHAASVVAAVVDSESGELHLQRLPGPTAKVVEFCMGLAGPVRVSYEAGGRASVWPVRWSRAASAVWSRRRARSRGRRLTGSRPIAVMRSCWCRLLMAGQLSAVRGAVGARRGVSRPRPRA